jgi:hypothetical protein
LRCFIFVLSPPPAPMRHNTRPLALPSAVRGYPLLVVPPLPPYNVVQLPRARRLQAPPVPLPPVNSLCRRASILTSSKGDVTLKAYVASVCFKCFRCFRGTLQVFCMDVVKVDRNIAYYVAMTIHVCCKRMFQMFHLVFFLRMLQVCLFGCCKCFIHMLQVFYLDIAYVLQWICKCF